MNDKTIAELREFYKSAVFNCWLNKRGADVLGEILSRATPAKDEPLAVLADRKGWWLSRSRHYPDRWVLNFDSLNPDYYGPLDKPIIAPTYAAAEAKARAYLESLPDGERGRE